MKRFYILKERGETQHFFCGQQFEAEPSDWKDWGYGIEMSFYHAECEELCKSFDTLEQSNAYWDLENEAMERSDNYAYNQMHLEDLYGCEGVDDMRNEY
jgi:hypothetical protein